MTRARTTIKEATERWVNQFNTIPQNVIVKLVKAYPDEMFEITPLSKNDKVIIFHPEHFNEHGYIIERIENAYVIELGNNELIVLEPEDFEVERYEFLPMWGAMWTFGENLDDMWLEDIGLQLMADCGFRIYQQEDFGYIFGIDGAGYDFYEEHWIPLYKARGLQWHDYSQEETS